MAAKSAKNLKVRRAQLLILGLLGLLGLLFVGLGIFYSSGISNSAVPQAGVDYELIADADPSRTGSTIRVDEFFSYGCIHCRNFDPELDEWLQTIPEDMLFARRPAAFSPSWATLGQGYLALEYARALSGNHQRMFRAVHDERRQFSSGQDMADYLDGTDFSAEDFMRAFNNPSVARALSRAERDMRRYAIRSVPTLIVAGKYRIDMGNGTQRALAVADYLIELERQGEAG